MVESSSNGISLNCEICNLICSGQDSYNEHLVQCKKKSESLKEKTQTTNEYYCKICDVDCQVAKDYDAHLLGKKHRKNSEYQSSFHQM